MIQLLFALLLGDPAPPTFPLDEAQTAPLQDSDDWVIDLTEGWNLIIGPKETIYPGYIASQYRATVALKKVGASDSEISGVGDSRVGLRLGGRIELFHFSPKDNPDGGVHVDAEVGYLGQFDQDNSTDNTGWDGFYALHTSWKVADNLAARVGLAHHSSHLGDEFIESTGRMRIDYTREEVQAGLSWKIDDQMRTYAEYGHGYSLNNKALQDEGRAQCGFEFESRRSPWNGRSKPYAAFDLVSYEEDSWEANWTLQAGVVSRSSNGTVWRFGLEYYDGRSPIGEFFQSQERHLAWGLWIDL